MLKIKSKNRELSSPKKEPFKKLASFFDAKEAQQMAQKLANFPRPNVANHCLIKNLTLANVDQVQWVIVGVPDERGVKNSLGRIGAKEGPKAFRNAFYKMPLTSTAPAASSLLDLGDFKIPSSKLKKDLKENLFFNAKIIAEIYNTFPKARLIVIGGGHDIAFCEIWGSLIYSQKYTQGLKGINHHVVNFDAHADLRPYASGKIMTSGTPFTLLLEQNSALFSGPCYHPFGLQKMSNPDFILDTINKNKVDAHWLEDMIWPEQQMQKLLILLQKIKGCPWHWNFDLDGFKMSCAPGVSAPQIFGLDPMIINGVANRKDLLKNLRSVGIYELSPKNDVAEMTARLAAKIVFSLTAWVGNQ